ncbi:MAG: hypothetical protein IPK82_01365 [Polyangiaceae bacterium]|nr:hypothetical protein [Polyangiaceae bacterium]
MSTQAPYRAHVQAPPPMPSVAICRSCGIIAPSEAANCMSCARPISEVRVQVPPQSADLFWVAVRCGFTCNQCKFLAPLDGLDVDGAVDCAHCGLRQRFDVTAWREALSFAHSVGDLAGPDPEGRAPHPSIWIGDENPYADIGVKKSFARGGDKVREIDIHACPGHPVCRKCRVPLTIETPAAGQIKTRCLTCNDEATFSLGEAQQTGYPAIMGAVADEHRNDRPRAQPMATQAGVVAMRCPGCGAPLAISGSDKVQTCSYCKVSCFIAAKNLARFHHKTPEPEVWWLLFSGVSEERINLTSATADVPQTGKNLLAALKPGAKTDTIGGKPGVYEAPEEPGIHWPQVLLTLLLGSIALAIGYLIAGRY